MQSMSKLYFTPFLYFIFLAQEESLVVKKFAQLNVIPKHIGVVSFRDIFKHESTLSCLGRRERFQKQ